MRENAKLSQVKMAEIIGMNQSSINRYESADSSPALEILVKYADYFDVSLDYIFGRTDKPQGKLYEHKPRLEHIYPEMEQFVEMCFDPGSPMNKRLKETIMQMLKEGKQ